MLNSSRLSCSTSWQSAPQGGTPPALGVRAHAGCCKRLYAISQLAGLHVWGWQRLLCQPGRSQHGFCVSSQQHSPFQGPVSHCGLDSVLHALAGVLVPCMLARALTWVSTRHATRRQRACLQLLSACKAVWPALDSLLRTLSQRQTQGSPAAGSALCRS